MLSFILFILVPMIVAASGLVLVVRASKISTHHQCLICGYDLRGLPTTPRCPECGAELDGSNTIVPGQLRTRGWHVAFGVILTFVGLVSLAVGFVAFMVTRMIDMPAF